MKGGRFEIALAARDLLARGLLAGVRLPGGQEVSPDEIAGGALGQAGFFVGAGLDNRHLQPRQLFVALAGERADGRRFAPRALAAGHWVLTRPVDGEDSLGTEDHRAGVILAHDPEAALMALAAAWRDRWPGHLVGVTGSNGKTTTKDLLRALLAAQAPCLATRGNMNSRLGMPVTLLELRPEHHFAVVEMGASAVGHIAALARVARPEVGVITNAGQAHLEEFGSLDGVVQGKGEMLDGLPPTGRAVLNADSPGYRRWLQRCPCPVLSHGQAHGDHRWIYHPDQGDQPASLEMDGQIWPVPLPGVHNAANLATALLAGRALGAPDEAMRKGLEDFRPSANRSHRLEVAGRSILDDSYNANPVSMRAAVAAARDLPTSGKLVAVLGHMAELGPDSEALHEETGQALELGREGVLLTVGPAARALAEAYTRSGGQAVLCADQDEALAWLQAHALPGDGVLVKGSRSAGLDQLVEKLPTLWDAREGEK